jgi:hypothetical protein
MLASVFSLDSKARTVGKVVAFGRRLKQTLDRLEQLRDVPEELHFLPRCQ